MWKPRAPICSVALGLLLVGCGSESPTGSYPYHPPADFSRAEEFARDGGHTFRFPLDDVADDPTPISCAFCSWGGPEGRREYHAAEDHPGPPGTPVYAMADGEVSFSGTAGGYGWLVIVDHPTPNLYSLYGHLSPSRWRRGKGPVGKGDLLAYLGDSHENGGSRENPLRPHLHFGVRAGQRTDYPGKGEWRWQAGWIRLRPTEIGWLRPSDIINAQHVPEGGFRSPEGGLLEIWGHELALVSVYLIGGACVLVFAIRRKKPRLLLLASGVTLVAGWLFRNRGLQLSWVVLAVGAVLAMAWLCGRARSRSNESRKQPQAAERI